jgi:multiple sugar transport system ATP-binding protein
MAKVSLQHLTKSAGAAGAHGGPVQDFSLEVSDREFVVITSPAGCGGSTVLRLIAGLEKPSAGEIILADKRVNDLPARERDVALVLGGGTLYPRMTVLENMAYGLKLRGFKKPEIDRRVKEAAEHLALEPFLAKRPAVLTAEERHRVTLARAVARQPKLFLLDEPLADFDQPTRSRLRTGLIRLRHTLQATMIHFTADSEEAMTMGDRIVVMKDGVIQQTGAPLSLYQEPDNLFVAGFLGQPPMNLIQGKLREAGEAVIFKEAGEGVLEIKIPNRPWLKPHAGREVIAGVRPEHIVMVAAPRQGTPFYRSLLDVVEPTGAGTLFHLETGGHRLIGRTARGLGSDEAGHRVQFEIDPDTVHLFDPETTRRITA